MRKKSEKKGVSLIFIGLIILLVGYTLGCVLPPTHFLSTSESSLTKANGGLNKSIEYIDTAINLTEQGQYGKAREMLNESKKSSDKVGESIKLYEKEKHYLDTLRSCMNNLIYVLELSETNNTVETIECINKFLADFSVLENIGAEITEEYPEIAERLNIEETMVNLRSIEYDMVDFKDEYERNKTVPPPQISLEGYTKEFKWNDHLGKEWSFKVKISERKYEKHKNLSHEVKEDKDYLKFVTDEDGQIKEIAQWFNNTYTDREDEANCILRFVQVCIPSIPEERTEYFKYPVETIIEGGDCEDKTILFLSIMKAEGHDVAFASYPYHDMGGVALKGELKRVKKPCYAIPIESEEKYYLCETIEKGFKIGSVPEEYKGIYPDVLVIPN